jgi:hypothetical protein
VIETPAALVAEAQQARAAQDMPAACAAMDAAARAAPDHPGIAAMRAQCAFEGWYPAAALFERAALLNPGNADVVRGFALALAAEGQGARAERLLDGVLARMPGWLEGHGTLATIRVTAGDSDPWRSYAQAAEREPANGALWQAWFQKLAAAKDWARAEAVLDQAEARGVTSGLAHLRLYLTCETGTAPADPVIFAPFAGSADPGLALLQIRHALRHGDPARALALAEGQLTGAHAAQFWPYVSLCWRLLDDPRAGWLEGEPGFAEAFDLDLAPAALADLTAFVRALHRMAAPYPEQSVRGGVQTDRNLLLHHDPLIRTLRARLVQAVSAWRDGLPDDEPAHPLLSRKPAAIRFPGSWSVRLAPGGWHSAHTHPQGWASTALYLTVPEDPGPDHAGELALGLPPPELGLGLAASRYITPKPGQLAIFPSTTWHGTIPFKGAERLTIAFDIAPQTSGIETQYG